MKRIVLGLVITLAGVVSARAGFQSDENNYRPYIGSYGYSENELRMVVDTNGQGDFATGGEIFDDAQLRFEWWHQYNNYLKDSFILKMSALRYGILESWIDSLNDAGLNPDQTPEDDGQRFVGPAAGQVFNARNRPLHGVTKLTADGGKDLVLPWAQASTEDDTLLMAAKIWESDRGFGETTFVQPLMPENRVEEMKAWLPHAVPCFEDSPIYWSGRIMYNDAADPSARSAKTVHIPWEKVPEGATVKLALESDIKPVTLGLVPGASNSIRISDGDKHLSILSSYTTKIDMFYNAGSTQHKVTLPTYSIIDELNGRIESIYRTAASWESEWENKKQTVDNLWTALQDARTTAYERTTQEDVQNIIKPYTQQLASLNSSMTALNTRYTESMTNLDAVYQAAEATRGLATTVSNAVNRVELNRAELSQRIDSVEERVRQLSLPIRSIDAGSIAGAHTVRWSEQAIKIFPLSSATSVQPILFSKVDWPEYTRTSLIIITTGMSWAEGSYTHFTRIGEHIQDPSNTTQYDAEFLDVSLDEALSNVDYKKIAICTAIRIGDKLHIHLDHLYPYGY